MDLDKIEKEVIITDENRQRVLSENYFIRYNSCNTILKNNNIIKEISDLRRIFPLICSDNNINNYKQALILLEKYIKYYDKDIDFEKLDKRQINELFYDFCFDYKSLTVEKAVKFFENGAYLFYLKDIEPKLTLFHFVSRSSDIDLNREFLKRGADINAQYGDNDIGTIWNYNHECLFDKIKLYLEYGAKINSTKSNGKTVLHDLCESYKSNTFESIKYLIEKQADINLKDYSGKSCLHLASSKSNKDVVLFLIEKGLDINAVDNDGNTPLLIATLSFQNDIVKLLVEKGANKEIKNLKGKSAYEISLDRKLLKIAEILNPENYLKDYENRPEFTEIKNMKQEILYKLKNGYSIRSWHKEGSDIFEFKDGVYKEIFYNEYEELELERIIKTDEEALIHLIGEINFYRSELETCKTVLSRLFNW